ncbi:transposase (plasmid) [Rhodovastum atsumiense]|uniref:IS66 family transposase n=1 Tax=Rhodovastum atsumiense TaxID=504468 RepID=A0A5M6IIR4_9PROT|nr:IS66 family transposase [Rhodovastum atsumiense]KAA5608150.1 IS66 family transposase [Rhodovastum atsumiense]CAH2605782.1 transposase [Rhodovastum atsumiense]
MQIDLTALPDDSTVLQSMVRDAVTATLQRDAQVTELTAEVEKLQAMVRKLLRHRFGRRSEQMSPDQLALVIEDLEQEAAAQEAAKDAAETSEEKRRQRRAARPLRNLGALPGHLPRDEVVIDVESKECPCCGGALHLIGEARTEMLNRVPAQLRVKVTRRPRYGCRTCSEAVVQAPAPERPIDGGMATEALLVQILVSKFCDFLPLYRQAEMLKREGITIDRSTLSDWVGRTCWWLRPLYDLVVSTVLSAPKLFADDTTLPVLDPGQGKTRTGRLWCYAVDDRPWKGATHPAAAYLYGEDRKATHPMGHLAKFRGVLQVDGYAGFASLVTGRRDDSIQLAFCWAHTRRPFYEFFVSTKSPIAAEALARIGKLYEIEAEIRGQSAEHRRAVRQERSRPIVEALHAWLQEQLPRLSGSSDLAKAMRYALRHWSGLVLFLEDGRIELDTNSVERAIRPVALTRKNALFAGSNGAAEHWAIAMTLIATAKLNGVEPLAWLTDVLERLVSGRTRQHELEQLLPWNWRPPGAVPVAGAA